MERDFKAVCYLFSLRGKGQEMRVVNEAVFNWILHKSCTTLKPNVRNVINRIAPRPACVGEGLGVRGSCSD
jgi:hypothetical protein